jgi:uncharacterized lipoprotein YmbA
MKKWLLAAAVCALTACSSGGKQNILSACRWRRAARKAPPAKARLLWVEQVSIPDYLAGNGVVYQTTDVQYVIANNNLWASPLDQQLRTTLVANLSKQLPGWVVSSQPLGSEQDTLNVRSMAFTAATTGGLSSAVSGC